MALPSSSVSFVVATALSMMLKHSLVGSYLSDSESGSGSVAVYKHPRHSSTSCCLSVVRV